MSEGLVDHTSIYVKGGEGGNGSRSLRREKYVPQGGPDGGDGGRGGNVYLVTDANLGTLLDFKRKVHWRAENGEKGGAKRCSGSEGQDVFIKVPPGTVVFDQETGLCLADLYREGQTVMVARGGRGGRGNQHFANSRQQTPRHADLGEPGEDRWLLLDLQMLAEVGIVGFPNAGKSSLLGVISRAEPKVGDYPFTTLQPILGVVAPPVTLEAWKDRESVGVVFADLPGLVEGASQGVGLGSRFLRHVERTRVLLHLLDLTSIDIEDPLKGYRILRKELEAYSESLSGRPEILAVNKCELLQKEEALFALRTACHRAGKRLYEISCHEKRGTRELLEGVFTLLEDAPIPVRYLAEALPDRTHYEFRVEFEVDCWRIHGQSVEALITATDMTDPDAVRRVQRKMVGWGVEAELFRLGAVEGDTVRIGKHLFDFEPTSQPPTHMDDTRRPEGSWGADPVDIRPSQVERLERRRELRQSAREEALAAAAEAGTRGRGRKGAARIQAEEQALKQQQQLRHQGRPKK